MGAQNAAAHEHLLAGDISASRVGTRPRRTVRLEVPLVRMGDLSSFLPSDLKRFSPEITATARAEMARTRGERQVANTGSANPVFP